MEQRLHSSPRASAAADRYLKIAPGIQVPRSEIRETFVRSGGPGGQNVNKVSTKVVLRFDLASTGAIAAETRAWMLGRIPGHYLTSEGKIMVASDRWRDQARNRVDAEARLANLLATAAARPRVRRPTHPTAAASARRHRAKAVRSRRRRDRSIDDGEVSL